MINLHDKTWTTQLHNKTWYTLQKGISSGMHNSWALNPVTKIIPWVGRLLLWITPNIFTSRSMR